MARKYDYEYKVQAVKLTEDGRINGKTALLSYAWCQPTGIL